MFDNKSLNCLLAGSYSKQKKGSSGSVIRLRSAGGLSAGRLDHHL